MFWLLLVVMGDDMVIIYLFTVALFFPVSIPCAGVVVSEQHSDSFSIQVSKNISPPSTGLARLRHQALKAIQWW